MSDISIPGINSRFNTETLVQDLVDAESIRLSRLQDDRAEFENERDILREYNITLSNLRTSTRALFSFENPFNERNAVSSNSAVLRAQANRDAQEGVVNLRVVKTAQADRFLSREVPRDFEVPRGIYRFTVGSEALTLRFRGGSIREFSEALNARNPELIRSSLVQNTADSFVITIESQREGAANVLGFEGDAEVLALDLAWLERTSSHSFDFSPLLSSDSAPNALGEAEIMLAPGERVVLSLNEPIDSTENLILSYQVSLQELPRDSVNFANPSIRSTGSVNFAGITLPNLPSVHPTNDFSEFQEEIVEESRLVFARNAQGDVALPDINDSSDFIPMRIQLSDYIPSINSLVVENNNSHKLLSLRELEITNPLSRGNTRPVQAISTAGNAELEIEGIPVVRYSNSVDDLIPGVSLDLLRSSEEEIELRVEPDIDLVKDALFEWVGRYNQSIRDTNILTRREQSIIDEIEYFTDEERSLYSERLGVFQGDSALNSLRSRLQSYTTNSYPTIAGSDFALLSQAGISTNASRGSTGFSPSRLRGYLEINESELDRALQEHFLALKDIFGFDSDGDLVIDSGIAFNIDRTLRSYTERGGIIATKEARYDSLISGADEDIENYEEYLQDYEENVRRDFAIMESAINSLENSAGGLEGLNSNNNNNN